MIALIFADGKYFSETGKTYKLIIRLFKVSVKLGEPQPDLTSNLFVFHHNRAYPYSCDSIGRIPINQAENLWPKLDFGSL